MEFAVKLISAAIAKFLNNCNTTVPRTPVDDSASVIAQRPEEERWAAEAIAEVIIMSNSEGHCVGHRQEAEQQPVEDDARDDSFEEL